MKKILITGKGSYIGSNLRKYLEKYPELYQVEELDMMEDGWKKYDFSGFDVVFHVAGLAHKKEVKDNKSLYFEVNKDLAIEVAKKARYEGTRQFIFMSSMSVYGLIYSDKGITENTKCNPNTYYGKSKYEAELGIIQLQNEEFKICILRPPMVYGKDSPGNLTKLFKIVKKVHIFPTIKNKRSSISIEKLIEYVKDIIDEDRHGLFLPQNNRYLCTYEIVKEKMAEEKVKILYTPIFNPLIKIMIGRIDLITKCFGDLTYGK